MKYTMTRAEVIRMLTISPNGLQRLERYGDVKFKVDETSNYYNKRKYYNKESVMRAAARRRKHSGRPGKPQKTKQGYIVVSFVSHPYCNSSGYVYQHRLVMEEHLGRYLLPEEIVHHKDGNRSNNKISNLTLFSSQSEHLSNAQHLSQRVMKAAMSLKTQAKLEKFLEKINV